MVLTMSVEREAARLGFADPADAIGLIDRSLVTFDDAGKPENVKALLGDLAKAKPYLIASRRFGSADSGSHGAPPPAAARTFTRTQLRDAAFYREHKTEIEAAMREGRIVNG